MSIRLCAFSTESTDQLKGIFLDVERNLLAVLDDKETRENLIVRAFCAALQVAFGGPRFCG
jgi:hypothetical protein